MGRESEFDAAKGIGEGIHGRSPEPAQTEPKQSLLDMARTKPLLEDPAITARATADVKAKIAARKAEAGRRLTLRRPGSP